MTKIKVLRLVIFFLATATIVCGQDCPRLLASAPEDLLSFLEGSLASGGEPNCTTIAIRQLGAAHYEPAIPVLTRLLDFKRPTGEDQIVRNLHSPYPAIGALEEIGRGALPNLLTLLKSTSGTQTARDNALRVWMFLYRAEPPIGISELKREADESADPATKQRLLGAASAAVQYCERPAREQCQAALTKSSALR